MFKEYHGYHGRSNGLDPGFEEDPDLFDLIDGGCRCCNLFDDLDELKRILESNPYNFGSVSIIDWMFEDDDLIDYICKVDIDGIPGCREKIIRYLLESGVQDMNSITMLARYESIDEAVKTNPRYVGTELTLDLTTEKDLLTLLKHKPESFLDIPGEKLTEEMCMIYIRYHPDLFEIPQHLRTPDLIELYNKVRECYIEELITKKHLTKEMCDAFIEKNPYQRVDDHIPIPLSDKSLNLLAEHNPGSYSCLVHNKASVEIINTFIRNFPTHLDEMIYQGCYHGHLLTDTWKYLLNFNPNNLRYIPWHILEDLTREELLDDNFWIRAFNMNASLIAYIPERLITQEMATKAVLRNWNNIENIPFKFITLPMMKKIIRTNDDILTTLPAELFPEDCNFGFLYF